MRPDGLKARFPATFPAESVANFGWFAMKILGVISFNLWWFILGIELIIDELGFDNFGAFQFICDFLLWVPIMAEWFRSPCSCWAVCVCRKWILDGRSCVLVLAMNIRSEIYVYCDGVHCGWPILGWYSCCGLIKAWWCFLNIGWVLGLVCVGRECYSSLYPFFWPTVYWCWRTDHLNCLATVF
jgi:hypothetical protein